MAEPSGVAMTNQQVGSVARIQHSDPNVTLMGRIAGKSAGYIGKLGRGGKPDLHFTLVVDDVYSGIFGFDGQPTFTDTSQIDLARPSDSLARMTRIKTLFYRDILPEDVVVQLPMEPPPGMSRQLFAQRLIQAAQNFASFTLPYSASKKLVGEVMVDGTYNSSSYIAGLLQSVMGYVPEISTPQYQTPGWETPIPAAYFKGEALR